MRTMLLAFGLWAYAIAAHGQGDFPIFLDGSMRPGDAGWTRDGQQGQVIDLGDGNKAIRQIDGGDGYDKYYITIFDTANTLATRFRVDAYSHDPADPRIQILALTTGGGGPGIGLSIFNKDGQDRWILDRFTAGHVELLDVGPVVIGEWNVALMHLNTDGDIAHFEWNYEALFEDFLPADYGGPEGYAEFGASNYWAQGGTSTVLFDWVGYGPGFIAVVPEPSSLVLAVAGLSAALAGYAARKRRRSCSARLAM